MKPFPCVGWPERLIVHQWFLSVSAKFHDFSRTINTWMTTFYFSIVECDLCPLPSTFYPLTSIPFFKSHFSLLNPYSLHFCTMQNPFRGCSIVMIVRENLWCMLACLSLIIVKLIAESCAWSLTMRCWSTSWVGNFTQTQEAECFSLNRSFCCGAAEADATLRLTGAKEPAVPRLSCCLGCLEKGRV